MPSWQAAATSLLARAQYAPATNSAYTLNSSALTALDTTNLTLAFTAPSSGAVIIRMRGGKWSSPSATQPNTFGRVTHNTTTQVGVSVTLHQVWGVELELLITGLTGGNAYQYDLAGYSGVINAILNVQGVTGIAGTGSPLIMEAWAA